MEQNNNTTAAQQTAARNYRVSNTTAAILDCITAVEDLYSQISDAMGQRYGTEGQDEHAEAFLQPVNDIIDMLHKELQGQVIDALMTTDNSHSSSPVI